MTINGRLYSSFGDAAPDYWGRLVIAEDAKVPLEASLSLAYDIVPTPVKLGAGTDFRLAMSVGEQGREATFENALSRSARFGLSMKGAQGIITQLLEITGNWREHCKDCGISAREVDLLAPSFALC